MKALLVELGPSPLFRRPACSLMFAVRRSAHEMDCYAVEAEGPEALDELPRLLGEKRARLGR